MTAQLALFACNAATPVAGAVHVCALPPHGDRLHYDGRFWHGQTTRGPWAVKAVPRLSVAEILESVEGGRR